MFFKLIAYFIVIMILLYIYLVFFLFVGKTLLYIYKEIKQFIAQKRDKTKDMRKIFEKEEYLNLIKSNPFLLQAREQKMYAVAIIIANILFWQYFRYQWVNDEYQHKRAMEYHSLSHFLLSYEMGMLTVIRNPDSIILKPLNLLQDSLIDSAKEHLPKDDGEIEAFEYFFKLYPYVSTHYNPSPSEAKKLSAMTYHILKGLSTKKIEDKETREFRKYLYFLMAAEYYIYIQWEEYGIEPTTWEQAQLSGIALFNDPVKIKQLEDIGRWALKHYKEYKKYPKIKEHIKQHEILEAMLINEIVAPLREVEDSRIFHLTYRCNDELIPIIYKYVEIYTKKFYGRATQKEFWKYDNITVNKSKDFSNIGYEVCGFPPIKYTYSENFKDYGYSSEYYKSLTPEYRASDINTHYKWPDRALLLKKIIKNHKK